MSAGLPSFFFLSCDFFVRMCLLLAFLLFIFPVPVSVKRFLALEFVFILGIAAKLGRAKIEKELVREKIGSDFSNARFDHLLMLQ